MKRLIPFFLASALLLTGCPGSEKQNESDTPAETTAAVTAAPSEPAETETAVPADTDRQADTKPQDSAETTSAATTAKPPAGTAASAAQQQDELPVIGGDSADRAPAPQNPAESEPDDELTFNEDGVIELPIIPIR